MRTALCIAFVFVLASAGFAGTDEFTVPGTSFATDGTFDILYEFPILALDDAHNVGIGFDGTYIWVSAGDATTGVCHFYLYDEMGNLVYVFDQMGGATGWGHRDLCFDGTYMFGSFDTTIHAFSTGGEYMGYFNGPGISPCRALAYDGYYFYTCGFGEAIHRGHWDGVWGSTPDWQIISGDVISGCYGMAYDGSNDCLWVSTADYTGDILQFTTDGLQLGTHTTLPEYDIMGGSSMINTAAYGMTLGILMQFTPDTVVLYDVDAFTPVEDASWSSIKAMYR